MSIRRYDTLVFLEKLENLSSRDAATVEWSGRKMSCRSTTVAPPHTNAEANKQNVAVVKSQNISREFSAGSRDHIASVQNLYG
jgi:hypothetical protein